MEVGTTWAHTHACGVLRYWRFNLLFFFDMSENETHETRFCSRIWSLWCLINPKENGSGHISPLLLCMMSPKFARPSSSRTSSMIRWLGLESTKIERFSILMPTIDVYIYIYPWCTGVDRCDVYIYIYYITIYTAVANRKVDCDFWCGPLQGNKVLLGNLRGFWNPSLMICVSWVQIGLTIHWYEMYVHIRTYKQTVLICIRI